MRFLSFLFLVIFLGAVGVFAWQNQEPANIGIDLGFFAWRETASLALIVGAAYLLGMLSGWSVVGMVRRSFNNVAADVERRQQAGTY